MKFETQKFVETSVEENLLAQFSNSANRILYKCLPVQDL